MILSKATRGSPALQTPHTPNVEVAHEVVDAAQAVADEMSAQDRRVVTHAHIHQMVGRVQALNFVGNVAARAVAEQYLRLKAFFNENKDLELTLPDGSRKRVSGVEDACEFVLGKSARRCRQIVADVNLLGPELYEAAEQLGFRARDYQALKALPADSQEAVKKVLASDDREAAIDLVYDLAARLQAVEQRTEELAHDVEAKDRLIDEKNKKIDKLATRRAYKPREGDVARNETDAAQLEELKIAVGGAELTFMRLANVVAVMQANDSAAMRGRALQAVQYLVRRLADVVDEHGLEVSVGDQIAVRPEWLDMLPTDGTTNQ